MLKKIIKVLEAKFVFYFLSIIYRIVLDFSYITYISPNFSYDGFHYNFNYLNYILSWLLTIILIFATPRLLSNISDYFLCTFTFNIIIPILCMFGLNYDLSIYPVIVNLIIYFLLYFGLKVSFIGMKIKYPYVKNGESIFEKLCIAMIVYLIIWYIVSGSINNFNLDLLKVYEFRDLNAELTNLGVLAYINTWVLNVFNLALISYMLLKKKYIYFFILCLVQIFFFGISAHKSVLFTPLVILSIYLYLSRTRSLATLPLAFSSLILICMALYIFNDDIVSASIFVRRLFFVPSQLTFVYFDFFSNNPYAYWTDSFSVLGNPVYPKGVSLSIGNYLGSEDLSANNGFISSGYAQAGIIGIAVYSFFILFILKTVNQLSKDINFLWFTLCIVITPFRALLVSSDLLTVLLTHGLIIAMLLLLLLRKSENKYEM